MHSEIIYAIDKNVKIALKWKLHFDGLVQDSSNSSASAMELMQSCTKPSI